MQTAPENPKLVRIKISVERLLNIIQNNPVNIQNINSIGTINAS